MLSRNITAQDENNFLVVTKYVDAEYEVRLSVIKDGDSYKIDDIEKIRISDSNSDDYVADTLASDNSYDDNQSSSPYSKYFGRWSKYIISQGKRVKVYTAIINRDMTARWILYTPDGSVNSDLPFKQCVFTNGKAYFTDNGDITIRMTPRFMLGSNGLQDAEGEDLVRE